MAPISNASRLAEFGSGIGTNGAIIQVDNNNQRVGIGTTNPQATLQVGTGVSVYGSTGIVSATSYYGDGSNLDGLVSAAVTQYIAADSITSSGIVTITNTTDATSTTTGALIISGGVGIAKSLHVGQNITIGGTLTYEDVTNVDSIGVVTARSGVNVSGGELTVGSGITMGIAGVATFSGTADVHLHDNVKLNVGDSSDLQIYNDGTNNYIKHTTAGAVYVETTTNLNLRVNSNENAIVATANEDVSLYYNASKKFETTNDGTVTTGISTATGVDVTSNFTVGSGVTIGSAGVSTFSGTADVHLLDNVRLNIGDGSDLAIYHSGSHGYITEGTGNLKISAASGPIQILKGASEDIAKFTPDGSVELYHNNVKTFETIGTGITIYGPEGGNGSILISADEGDDNADKFGMIVNTSGSFFLQNYSSGSWANNLRAYGGGSVELMYGDGTKKFETTNDGTNTTGIGTFTSHVSLPDNAALCLGNRLSGTTLGDLRLYHNGSHSYIDEVGTGNLYIRNGTDNAIWCETDGKVQLYYDNSVKLATSNDGVNITGIATFSQGCDFNGLLREKFNQVDAKLSAGTNIDLEDGMLHYYSVNETTTATPNIRYNSSYSLNNKMTIGEAVTITIIYKPNNAGYYASLNVDGSGVTEEWNGGEAPSSANSSGYDILTHTLIKTADATFLCFSNLQNYA